MIFPQVPSSRSSNTSTLRSDSLFAIVAISIESLSSDDGRVKRRKVSIGTWKCPVLVSEGVYLEFDTNAMPAILRGPNLYSAGMRDSRMAAAGSLLLGFFTSLLYT